MKSKLIIWLAILIIFLNGVIQLGYWKNSMGYALMALALVFACYVVY